MKTVKNNRDFFFLYEAIQNNPNGDPDQENKPRMDYDTKTNLVTDVRLKRFIRDYLKSKGNEIFVSLEDDTKVSMKSKLAKILDESLEKDKIEIFKNEPEKLEKLNSLLKNKKPSEVLIKKLNPTKKKEDKEIFELNKLILAYYVGEMFADIRMFGSAFAVDGFNIPYTGPIQINWGYSLNEVYLMDSNSIVTIMSDEASTFGKDYRVWYSLLAFYGTINENAAKTTFLTEQDVEKFREAIWNGINALPTRTKQNQYPLLYMEIIYKDGISNGYFGDLRQYIKVKPKGNLTFKQVRKLEDLEINFDKLVQILKDNQNIIEKVIIRKSNKIQLPELPNVKLLS